MNAHDKELIAQQVEDIVDELRALPDHPFESQIYFVIQDLFEVQYKLRGYFVRD